MNVNHIMDGRTDGWTDGLTDERTDLRTESGLWSRRFATKNTAITVDSTVLKLILADSQKKLYSRGPVHFNSSSTTLFYAQI